MNEIVNNELVNKIKFSHTKILCIYFTLQTIIRKYIKTLKTVNFVECFREIYIIVSFNNIKRII